LRGSFAITERILAKNDAIAKQKPLHMHDRAV